MPVSVGLGNSLSTLPNLSTIVPLLTSPVDTATGATTGSGSVVTNRSGGTLYWVISLASNTPSATQIKAGQNHLGIAAVIAGSQAVSTSGVQTISGGFTTLITLTPYFAHYMHEAVGGKQSNVASGDGFTTS